MRNAILLIIIVCLAAFLRIYDLGKQSIWLDEAAAFNRANKTPVELFYDQANESNPPVYDILLHYFLKMAHQKNEFNLRLFSAISGVTAVFFAFWVGRIFFNSRVGLWFSLMLSFSPYHIYYSQDAKMYALLSLFVLASLFFHYLTIISKKAIYPVLYICATILVVYTHSYGIFLLTGQCVAALFFYKSIKNRFKLLIMSMLLIFISVVPRLCIMAYQFGNDWNPHIRPISLENVIKVFAQFSFLGWGISITPNVKLALLAGLPVCLYLLYLAFFGNGGTRRGCARVLVFDDRRKAFFLMICLCCPIVIVILISLFKPIYVTGRYDMIVYPIFVLLLSAGLDKVEKRSVQAFLIIVMIISTFVCLYSYYTDFKKSNDREVAGYVNENAQPDDLLIFTYSTLPAFNYYSGDKFKTRSLSYPESEHDWLPARALRTDNIYLTDEIKKIKAKISLFQKKGGRLWVIYGEMFINAQLIRELKNIYKFERIINFNPGGNDVQASCIYIFRM